jgi:hypothetical protein
MKRSRHHIAHLHSDARSPMSPPACSSVPCSPASMRWSPPHCLIPPSCRILIRAASRRRLRFIMSLRATGEGHISSIEFRTGIIAAGRRHQRWSRSHALSHCRMWCPIPPTKNRFIIKLQEMGFSDDGYTVCRDGSAGGGLHPPVNSTKACTACVTNPNHVSSDLRRALECIRWLADSNYELNFSSKLALSERIIFPVSLPTKPTASRTPALCALWKTMAR